MIYTHIDGSVFTTEAELIAHIRSLASDYCDGLSDDFVYTEAYNLYEFKIETR